jgi:hypothetical protein
MIVPDYETAYMLRRYAEERSDPVQRSIWEVEA